MGREKRVGLPVDYLDWKKLPSPIEVDCPMDMEPLCPYPYYINATSLEDARRGKAVFVKGLYDGPDYQREPETHA